MSAQSVAIPVGRNAESDRSEKSEGRRGGGDASVLAPFLLLQLCLFVLVGSAEIQSHLLHLLVLANQLGGAEAAVLLTDGRNVLVYPVDPRLEPVVQDVMDSHCSYTLRICTGTPSWPPDKLFAWRPGGDRLSAQCTNFVRVLAGNRRLGQLPEISTLFEIQRRDAEGSVQAELVSAYPASDAQQAQVIASLRKRLGREVTLTCQTDSSLLGGAIIRAGDLVIDGSVRGKLERLGTALDS